MKKRLLYGIAVVAIAAIAMVNLNLNNNSNFSKLLSSSIEAMASEGDCQNTVTVSGSTIVTQVCDRRSLQDAKDRKEYCTLTLVNRVCWFDNKGNGMG